MAAPCIAFLRSSGGSLGGAAAASRHRAAFCLVRDLPGSLQEGDDAGLLHAKRLSTALQVRLQMRQAYGYGHKGSRERSILMRGWWDPCSFKESRFHAMKAWSKSVEAPGRDASRAMHATLSLQQSHSRQRVVVFRQGVECGVTHLSAVVEREKALDLIRGGIAGCRLGSGGPDAAGSRQAHSHQPGASPELCV